MPGSGEEKMAKPQQKRAPNRKRKTDTKTSQKKRPARKIQPPGERRNPGRPAKPLHTWEEAFITAYRDFPHIGLACEAAGISRSRYDKACKQSPRFKARVKEVFTHAAQILEDEAIRRALDKERKADGLLMFMLSSLKPIRYAKEARTRKVEVQLGGSVDVKAIARDERQRLARLAQDPEAAAALQVLAEREAALMTQDSQQDAQQPRTALPNPDQGNGRNGN